MDSRVDSSVCDGTCFASLIKRDAKLALRVRVFICAFDT